MNLKELKTRFDSTMKARREKREEIDRLNIELAKVKAAALTAADSGDLKEYKRLEAKKNDLEAQIFVYSRSLPSAGNPVTKEEAVKAWESFTETYNRDIKKQYEDYLDSCRNLAAKYEKLISVQNAALIEKEKALEIMGEPRNSEVLSMYMIPDDIPEGFTKWARTSPELAFFEGKGFYTRDKAESINQIVRGGHSAEL